MIGNVIYPISYLLTNWQVTWPFSLYLPIPIWRKHTYIIASEIYVKELFALSLSFPHFRVNTVKFRKYPPGLIFFKGSFRGAYLRREIYVSKLIGLALYLKINLPFLLCFTLYLRAIFQVQAPWGGLYLEGRFNGRFFALPDWSADIWMGFGIFQ